MTQDKTYDDLSRLTESTLESLRKQIKYLTDESSKLLTENRAIDRDCSAFHRIMDRYIADNDKLKAVIHKMKMKAKPGSNYSDYDDSDSDDDEW